MKPLQRTTSAWAPPTCIPLQITSYMVYYQEQPSGVHGCHFIHSHPNNTDGQSTAPAAQSPAPPPLVPSKSPLDWPTRGNSASELHNLQTSAPKHRLQSPGGMTDGCQLEDETRPPSRVAGPLQATGQSRVAIGSLRVLTPPPPPPPPTPSNGHPRPSVCQLSGRGTLRPLRKPFAEPGV